MFDYAAEKAGLENVWQVENNEFCQKLLKVRYPDAKRFKDIKEVTGEQLGYVDVVSGGFPCQPFSQAGKRKGKDDDRYLWEEMLRVIKEIKPSYVIGENVAGILNMGFEYMLLDLENEGYKVETFIIPACAVQAVHRRDRVWVVAYADPRYRPKSEIQTGRDTDKDGVKQCTPTNPSISNDRTHNGEQEGRQEPEFGESTFGKSITNTKSINKQYARLSEGKSKEQIRRCGCDNTSFNTAGKGLQKPEKEELKIALQNVERGYSQNWVEVATKLCGVDASSSSGILKPGHRKHRLEGLGNGIQWEIAQILFESIKEINNNKLRIQPKR